jgi:hypothetical protein
MHAAAYWTIPRLLRVNNIHGRKWERDGANNKAGHAHKMYKFSQHKMTLFFFTVSTFHSRCLRSASL